jgi:hypothetical protein
LIEAGVVRSLAVFRGMAVDLTGVRWHTAHYISKLSAKLGVEGRTQAATFAARLDERSVQAARIDGRGS